MRLGRCGEGLQGLLGDIPPALTKVLCPPDELLLLLLPLLLNTYFIYTTLILCIGILVFVLLFQVV